MFAGNASTVVGKLTIIGSSGEGCQTSITASQISSANSISVPWKLSGEYSKTTSPDASRVRSRHSSVARTARSTMPASSSRKTTRRCVVEVEL